MRIFFLLALLSILSACATSKPIVLPTRPAATNAEGASCLRLCDESYVSCTSSTASPIFMLDYRAALIGSILNGNKKSDKQKTCAEFLKYCYKDCELVE